MAIMDTIRLEWLKEQYGLHWSVGILYTPMGIELTLTYDDNPYVHAEPVQGINLRDAIDKARVAWRGMGRLAETKENPS